MAGYKLGLAVSIVLGVLVAAFPLYAGYLAGYIWSQSTGWGSHEEEAYTVTGTIEEVDPDESIIVVNGVRIKVTGTWLAPNGSAISSEDLIARLRPGMTVSAEYTKWGRWGYRLVELTIVDTGEKYSRIE